jgi:hypothetical protein
MLCKWQLSSRVEKMTKWEDFVRYCVCLTGELMTRRYWTLKMAALYRILYETFFVRGYEPVVRQTVQWMSVITAVSVLHSTQLCTLSVMTWFDELLVPVSALTHCSTNVPASRHSINGKTFCTFPRRVFECLIQETSENQRNSEQPLYHFGIQNSFSSWNVAA